MRYLWTDALTGVVDEEVKLVEESPNGEWAIIEREDGSVLRVPREDVRGVTD